VPLAAVPVPRTLLRSAPPRLAPASTGDSGGEDDVPPDDAGLGTSRPALQAQSDGGNGELVRNAGALLACLLLVSQV